MEIPKIDIIKIFGVSGRKKTLRTTVGTLWMTMTIILAIFFITTSTISLYIFYRINTNSFLVTGNGISEQYKNFDKNALSRAVIFAEEKRGDTIIWSEPSRVDEEDVTATSSIDRQ